jgi:hypothetical protein
VALAIGNVEAEADRRGVPSGGDQPAEMGTRRRRLVEVEGLWIELARKGLDLVGREGVAAPSTRVPTRRSSK